MFCCVAPMCEIDGSNTQIPKFDAGRSSWKIGWKFDPCIFGILEVESGSEYCKILNVEC